MAGGSCDRALCWTRAGHGTIPVSFGANDLELPFLALEYVHGGPEGTTLTDRVTSSIELTGHAFDRDRMVRLITCVGDGLAAVHEVGVIHRDLKPDNVLCCGYDEHEIFKIADFGIARPIGLAATFGNCAVGTPGYAPPEQYAGDAASLGVWSDVFALAAVLYYAMAGEHLFQPAAPLDAVLEIRNPRRRSVGAGPHTSPDIRENPTLCHEIDLLIAAASAYRHAERTPGPSMLLQPLRAALQTGSRRAPLSRRAGAGGKWTKPSPVTSPWRWQVRQQAGGLGVLSSVAWNSDGHCLAVSDAGLVFWDGEAWRPIPRSPFPDAAGVRLVCTLSPGEWLLGGGGARVARFGIDGVRETLVGPDPTLRFEMASGDWSDLSVIVATQASGSPMLCALSGGRWLRSFPLTPVANITGLARIGDARWLVVGRDREGAAYAGLYEPLDAAIERVATPGVRAFLACAADPQLEIGVAVGTEGGTSWIDHDDRALDAALEGCALSAVTLDDRGRAWGAMAGSLWFREGSHTRWQRVWADDQWPSPIVSLMAEGDRVIAVTVDGGLIEGMMGA